MNEDRLPILIVAGFLGAGKTTFIRELLPHLAGGPRAPYVILNDFLNASIDASSLRDLGAEIEELAAGCVCCDESDGLAEAILRIPTSIRPLLVLEANGSTDPYRLIETLTLTPALRDRVGGLLQVTVINGSRWGKRLFPSDKRTERAQVRTASALVTNRTDRATDRQKRKLRDDLMELNPRAPRMDAESFARLLCYESASASLAAPDRCQPIPHAHHHMAVSLTPPDMDVARLRTWLQSLPSDVLRVKGLVRTPDGDMCYCSRTDDPFEAPRIIRVQAREGMEPDVVFIGAGLSPDFLRSSFGNAAPAPAFRLF